MYGLHSGSNHITGCHGGNSLNKKLENMSIGDILFLFRKYIALILVLATLFGAAFFCVSKFLVPPKYESTSVMIVNATQTSDGGLTATEIDAYQKLVSTITEVISSDAVLQPVLNQLNLGISTEKLAAKITVAGVGTSNIIQLAVKDTDPATAARIANSIDHLAPDIIMNTVTSAASVKVITPAKVSNKPVSPNVPLLTLLGVLIGMVIAVCIAFLRDLLNNTFKTDEDVKNVLNMTVLGIIPVVAEKTK